MMRTLEGRLAIWKGGQNKLQLTVLANWRGGNFLLNKKDTISVLGKIY